MNAATLALIAIVIKKLPKRWMLVPLALAALSVNLSGDSAPSGIRAPVRHGRRLGGCAVLFCLSFARKNYLAYALVLWAMALRPAIGSCSAMGTRAGAAGVDGGGRAGRERGMGRGAGAAAEGERVTLARPAPADAPGASDHRAALLAGYLGWTLDAFDFFLVVFCLTAIGREFHKSDAAMALAITITLAFRPWALSLRPAGGPLRAAAAADARPGFLLGDRMLSGLAPSYTVFMVLRALFGIAWAANGRRRVRSPWRKCPPACAGCSPDSSSRAMPWATCWRLVWPHSVCMMPVGGERCRITVATDTNVCVVSPHASPRH